MSVLNWNNNQATTQTVGNNGTINKVEDETMPFNSERTSDQYASLIDMQRTVNKRLGERQAYVNDKQQQTGPSQPVSVGGSWNE